MTHVIHIRGPLPASLAKALLEHYAATGQVPYVEQQGRERHYSGRKVGERK